MVDLRSSVIDLKSKPSIMKSKNLFIAIICYMISLPLLAQDHGNQMVSKKLIAIDGLVGKWEGEGYIIDQLSRQKEFFTQTEHIYYALDSTIIMIEGRGIAEGKIVHDARAIISPSDTVDQFEFYSFLADGRKGTFNMMKGDEHITWTIPTPAGVVKYTITLKEDEYHEIGEFGMNGEWYPFMEMNLKRVN